MPTDESGYIGSTTSFDIERSYMTVEGKMQLPVNGGQSIVVKTCDPYQMMVITWTATREGGPPSMPDPTTFVEDTNTVLLSTCLSGMVPIPIGDLGHGWQVGGVYTYAILTPLSTTGDLPLGKMPWEQTSPAVISANNFDKGILAPQPSQSLTLSTPIRR